MTWAVDKDGDIVPWNNFMTDGKLDIKKLNTLISTNQATVRDNFNKTITEKEAILANLVATQTQPDAPQAGPEAEKLADQITNARNGIDTLKTNMNKAIDVADTQARLKFMQAGQNFVVHNLMEVISSPKNAIESSTPIGTAKIANAARIPDISKMFKGKLNMEDLFKSQKITNGINPFSTIEYEKITMAGKAGVGITASDLKAYLASFYHADNSRSHAKHRPKF